MTIEQILALNTTKTEKIRLLLGLGLTRSQVAQQLNVGYGFVQNVYARMQPRQAVNTQPQNVQHLNFHFGRTFGVEIECFNVRYADFTSEMVREGLMADEGMRRESMATAWKITRDGSITGSNSAEIVSPVLTGFDGMRQLRKACGVLRRIGAQVNRSCGLHVHIGAADFTIDQWRNLIKNYISLETVIDSWMPRSRRANANRYCHSMQGFDMQAIDQATTLERLRDATTGTNRYYKLNLQSFWAHRTVEFRHHGGTTDFEKIANWVYFAARMVNYSKTNWIGTRATFESLRSFLPEELLEYFSYRRTVLAA